VPKVNINPGKYLTPETVTAFKAFQKATETSQAQDVQMISDLELGAQQDKKQATTKVRRKSGTSPK
jgi:hypothetical protein